MPASFTTLPQCAICDVMSAPNSAGEPPAGSAAIFANASRTAGLRQGLVDRFVQTGDDGVRRAALHHEADPVLDDEFRKSRLDDGGDILQGRHPLWPRDGERTQLAGGNQVEHGQRRDELVVVGAVEEIGDHVRSPTW